MSMSVYEIVRTNILKKIEEAIKNGETFHWVKPWKGYGFPMNFVSKKKYRGINLLLLPMGGYYMTMKQVQEKGGKVKKGSKAFNVYFWSYVNSKKEDTTKNPTENAETEYENKDKNIEKRTDKKKRCVFKYYKVFHQSQILGIEFPKPEKNEHELDMASENFIKEYNRIVPINIVDGSDRAYYSPSQDIISVPSNTQFENINRYYSTILHEMIHSTGHSSRLDRFEPSTTFGDSSYSKEELIAEIGSSMLRVYLGIECEECDKNSIAYLQSWYNHIKDSDVGEITFASQQAQKAMDFIINSINNGIELTETA